MGNKSDEFFNELASELAEEAESFSASAVPSNASAAELSKLGEKYWEYEQRRASLESELEQVKKEIANISRQELPSLMATLGVDRLGLPQANADIVVSPFYHANISKDWDVEQREEAFEYLDSLGAGGLIRTIVTLSFGRDEIDRARAVIAMIRQAMSYLSSEDMFGLPDPEVEQTVPWNTLTKYVKEQIEGGQVIDLEKLGATTGMVATIKPRKESKK